MKLQQSKLSCTLTERFQHSVFYFEGKQDYQTTVNLIKQHSRNYCKRQFTFLKTIPDLTFCTKSEAEEKIKEFMND